jgi:elongation factor Ts
MSNISASLVKELREKTGAGMMDCKNALTENNGDIESSVDWLRTKGLAKAAKKSGRVASEGLIAISSSESFSVIVEVNSETDFVARNESFQDVANTISQLGLLSSNIDDLKIQKIENKDVNVEEYITEMISSIGENINLRRMVRFESSNTNIASYIHGQVSEGLGKIGVMVNLKSTINNEVVNELGKKIAMHIAATNPLSISIDDIPSDTLERERNILIEEARESGKPEEIIEKMIEGRLKKFYQESVLLEQTYVIDGESKVADVLKSLDSPVEIIDFVRYELGEGIEKDSEDDFASEVDSMVSGN